MTIVLCVGVDKGPSAYFAHCSYSKALLEQQFEVDEEYESCTNEFENMIS